MGILAHIINILGYSKHAAFRGFDENRESSRLTMRWELHYTSFTLQDDECFCAVERELGQSVYGRLFTVRLSLISGLDIRLQICHEKFIGIALPDSRFSKRVAEIYASVCRHAMRQAGLEEEAAKPFIAFLRNKKTGSIAPEVLTADTPENDGAIYNSLLTAILTNNETDFDMEIAVHELRTQTRVSRERIKNHMKSLGLKVLKGKKADVHLRTSKRGAVIDVEKLAAEYPEAYKACLRNRESREFLQIKVHA